MPWRTRSLLYEFINNRFERCWGYDFNEEKKKNLVVVLGTISSGWLKAWPSNAVWVQINAVRNVQAMAEDAAAAAAPEDSVGAEMRRAYAVMDAGNQAILNQSRLRHSNHQQLMSCLRQVNMHVQHAAKCRGKRPVFFFSWFAKFCEIPTQRRKVDVEYLENLENRGLKTTTCNFVISPYFLSNKRQAPWIIQKQMYRKSLFTHVFLSHFL